MRPIHLANVGGKRRAVLVLTRQPMIARLTKVTIAPITSTIRNIPTELKVGPRNGLDHDSVVSLDNVVTIDTDGLGPQAGWLTVAEEESLAAAIAFAYDLSAPPA